ncbi:MAG: hypothetical protein ABW034_08575 [Steroidobacteraceae bacterium]
MDTHRPESETSRQLVLKAWAHLAVGEMAAFSEYLDVNVHWRVIGADFLPNDGRFPSKAIVMQDLLGMSVWDYAQYKMTITRTYADGPHVVLEFVVDAKTKDGRRYPNAEYAVVVKVKNALIVEVREYVDGIRARNALSVDRTSTATNQVSQKKNDGCQDSASRPRPDRM